MSFTHTPGSEDRWTCPRCDRDTCTDPEQPMCEACSIDVQHERYARAHVVRRWRDHEWVWGLSSPKGIPLDPGVWWPTKAKAEAYRREMAGLEG